jgi:hypothetical protein
MVVVVVSMTLIKLRKKTSPLLPVLLLGWPGIVFLLFIYFLIVISLSSVLL